MNEPKEQTETTRKGFIASILSGGAAAWLFRTSFGGVLAAVFYPVVRYIIPPKIVESTVSSVTLPFPTTDVAPNSGRIFKFGNDAALLVRTASGDIRAFSARCTHLDCIVQYRQDLGEIWCACHNGHFDLTGRNIAGPPPKPLDVFDVRIRADQIIVSRRG